METINEMCELTPPCECDCNPDKDLSQGNIRPNYSPSPCGADSGVCGEHILEHPLHLWAIKYGVEGHLKFIGVAVVQAPTRSAAECIFAKNSLFSGTPERLKILAMKEVMPWSEPILFEDCAAIIDRRNLKSYPFLLKSDYEQNIQNISDNVIEAVEDYIEHNPIQQVNSDWNETDETSKAYILNKPTIPDAQVQSNWNETDTNSKAYIQNKPEIPEAQVQSDWAENNTSSKAFILNKPTDLVHTSDIVGLLKNDGTVYTGKYLEQVQDLDNFQASEGKIVQYIGATNSKYTNGYVYKKTGIQTIIPSGTDYIEILNRWTWHSIVDKCGIAVGFYYKTDKTDNISSNIYKCTKWSFNSGSGGINVYQEGNNYKVRDNAIGIWWISGNENRYQFRTVSSVSYSTYQGVSYPRSVLLEQMGGELSANVGVPIVMESYQPSEITIFENINGQKIYCRQENGEYILLPLDYDGEHYQVITNAPLNPKYYTNGVTQESIIIDTTEWVQWDVQPREDTSHFVTDSEIGWIEH